MNNSILVEVYLGWIRPKELANLIINDEQRQTNRISGQYHEMYSEQCTSTALLVQRLNFSVISVVQIRAYNLIIYGKMWSLI